MQKEKKNMTKNPMLATKKENELKYTTQSPKIIHHSLFMSLNKGKGTNTQEIY